MSDRYALCRWWISGPKEPTKFCGRPLTGKPRAMHDKPYCDHHLARLPFWPDNQDPEGGPTNV